MEKHSLLGNNTYLLTELFNVHILDVHAADLYLAGSCVIETGDKVDKRGFSRACAADDTDSLALCGGEGDV